MKRLFICVSLLGIGVYSGFFCASASISEEYARLKAELVSLSVRAERMIPAMITARDSHQYFVDNPGQANHQTRSSQDAEWVVIYDEVIDILEELLK